MSEQKLVPELRFPGFEGDWEVKKGDQLFKSRRERGDESLPIYSVTQGNGLVPRDSLDRKMEADAASEQNLKVCPNDIVYNMMRMWQGAIGLANTDCMVSPAYIVLKATNLASPSFFNYMFKRSRPLYDLWAYSYGLTNDRLRLYYKDFARIPFHVPKSNEQQKIADFLSSVDAKLAKLSRKKELLEGYKRGLMQQIFSQKLRFKQDDGSEFPEWETRTLKDLAQRRTNKNVDGSAKDVLTNSATRGIVRQQDYFDKDIANAENLEGYYIVQPGDYIYNPRISVHAPVGPIGKNHLGLGVMSPLYSVFSFYQDDDRFYEFYFKSSMWHRYMKTIANYGARHDRMNITTEDFLAMPLPAPNDLEQQKIADFLSSFDQKIDVVSKQIEQLEAFKKGLLQKLFV